jgi:hypothetical protein
MNVQLLHVDVPATTAQPGSVMSADEAYGYPNGSGVDARSLHLASSWWDGRRVPAFKVRNRS